MSEMNLDLSSKAMAKEYRSHDFEADASLEQVKKVCDEAKEYSLLSVYVNTGYVGKFVARQLAGTDVKPCVVVGFPLEHALTEAKAFEAKDAIERGAKGS